MDRYDLLKSNGVGQGDFGAEAMVGSMAVLAFDINTRALDGTAASRRMTVRYAETGDVAYNEFLSNTAADVIPLENVVQLNSLVSGAIALGKFLTGYRDPADVAFLVKAGNYEAQLATANHAFSVGGTMTVVYDSAGMDIFGDTPETAASMGVITEDETIRVVGNVGRWGDIDMFVFELPETTSLTLDTRMDARGKLTLEQYDMRLFPSTWDDAFIPVAEEVTPRTGNDYRLNATYNLEPGTYFLTVERSFLFGNHDYILDLAFDVATPPQDSGDDTPPPAPPPDEAPNRAPTANNLAFDLVGGQTAEIRVADLLANDTDPDGDRLSLVRVFGAVNGTVSIDGNLVVFTPNTGFTGQARFSYEITDGRGGFDIATVFATVAQGGSVGGSAPTTPFDPTMFEEDPEAAGGGSSSGPTTPFDPTMFEEDREASGGSSTSSRTRFDPTMFEEDNEDFGSHAQVIRIARSDIDYMQVRPDTASARVQLNNTPEVILLDDRPNTIIGTPQQFDESIISNFNTIDRVVMQGVQFGREQVEFIQGSVVMYIDTDGNGAPDTTLVFADQNDPELFVFSLDDGDTVIGLAELETPPGHEASDSDTAMIRIIGTLTGADARAPDAAIVRFHPDGAASTESAVNAQGEFTIDLSPGTVGVLTAERAYVASTGPAITANDALEVLRMGVGLDPSFGPAAPQNWIAADINGDSRVDASDALDILRAAVGLESANAPRWVFLDAQTDWDSVVENGVISYQEGIEIAAMTGNMELGLTGILLGSMSETA